MNYYLPMIEHLGFYVGREINNFIEKSYELIDKIYETMECIKVVGRDVKIIYVRYERGDFDSYTKFYKLKFKSKREYQEEHEYFLSEYYMEYDWIKVEIYRYEEYKTIIFNNDLIINVDPIDKRKGFEFDISDFLKDLYRKIQDSINLIINNTYYQKLCNEISFRQRIGIIKLDDLFNLNNNWKNDYFEFLSQKDIALFLKCIDKQIEYTNIVKKEASKHKSDFEKYCKELEQKYNCIHRLDKMNAKDYYDICKLCYKSINLESSNELPSKDLFYKYADGRDCGLKDIDLNSYEAFEEWGKIANDHAYQIRSGSTTSRIDLWVVKDDKGYYLVLSGKYLWISNEVIKFYVELTKNNIPVFLYDAEVIRDRLMGKGIVGIVPYKIFPRYCQSLFDIDICDFMHLPYYPKDYDEYLKYIEWIEVENTFLKGE
ncbi:MAG: hypothetical protein IKT40_08680 [Bacilli bacterium]|nr:hypothetical protein [Bacilli bacterium]